MKFKITVREEDDVNSIRDEIYTKDIKDPVKWGKETIEWYNSTIPQYGGTPRVFIGAEILSEEEKEENPPHTWKKSNMVTIIKNGMKPYDTYECGVCHITAKLFSLDTTYMIRDSRYKGDKYKYCNWRKNYEKKHTV